MKKLVIPTILSIILITNVNAQSPWGNDEKTSTITLDWDKPIFNSNNMGEGITASSSVLFLTGRFKATDRFHFIVDLPISHYGEKVNTYSDGINKTSIGNLYVGGEIELSPIQSKNNSYLEFGIRLPIMSDGESSAGAVTGILAENDRKEAFFPHTLVIPVIGNFIANLDRSFALHVRLGGIYDIYTDKDYWWGSENDLHLFYGLTALLRRPEFQAQLGVAGRNHLSGNGADFGDSGLTQIRGGISKSFNGFTPGLYVRLPLGNNYSDIINWAYGITMKINF